MRTERFTLDDALHDPAKVFDTPAEVVDDDTISHEDKVRILRQWELDCRELSAAEDENMAGGEGQPLDAVLSALHRLEEGSQARHGTGTGKANGLGKMTVGEVMHPGAETEHVDNTVRDAALRMRSADVGMLVIIDGDEVVGTLTDRDIAMRCVADDLNCVSTKVMDIMTPEVVFCRAGDTLGAAIRLMEQEKVRRLMVVDDDSRLCGILSVADIAQAAGQGPTSEVMGRISEPDPHHGKAPHPEQAHAHRVLGNEQGEPRVWADRPTVRH